jgi:hypothetical protein
MTQFTITIKGVDKDLKYPVLLETDLLDFKRFLLVGLNGNLIFEKTILRGGGATWKVVGRTPKTAAGKLQLEAMQQAIESWLYTRGRK